LLAFARRAPSLLLRLRDDGLLRVDGGAETELIVVRVKPGACNKYGRAHQDDGCERFEFGAESHNFRFEI
jgi:hypothetical protein